MLGPSILTAPGKWLPVVSVLSVQGPESPAGDWSANGEIQSCKVSAASNGMNVHYCSNVWVHLEMSLTRITVLLL